jgi:hypothetical protein
MFPNAELALMFIPVPIKAKYFVPGLVLVDLYLGISENLFLRWRNSPFCHVGGALFDLLLCGIGRKSVQSKPMELK